MSTKSLKPTKSPVVTPSPPSSRSSSLSAHLAMVEIKQRILTSLSRLADRDTHQIAVEDLETIIKTLSPDGISMILNSLFDAINDTTTNKPAVKKESIRLLAFLAATHTDSAATHLPKIIGNILKRLKDSDSGVKDACREAIGQLSFLYLKGENGDNNIGSVVSLFVKPLFDAMNEQHKGVQGGAAMCMAKMVEMASDHPPLLAFQKLNGRICKFLNSPNFLANAALLPVVGAISGQVLEPLLQSIHECLKSSDWTTRKAAADTLNVLALYSSNLITEKPSSTIMVLEACRFDKALQVWKHISEGCEDQKPPDHGQDSKWRNGLPKSDGKRTELRPPKDGQTDGQNVSEKTVGTKKKAPPLSDKELNPEFFQRLERRVSGEVEVVVNRRFLKSSNSQNEEEPDINDTNVGSMSKSKINLQDCNPESGAGGPSSRQQEVDDKNDRTHREGLMSSNGN
ncbi:Armadillo-like helical [Cynara cardunculus var. scolymus]|uniref:Armadillo-like helical n=1 Tax=Cynara cardunculus var. scolymus TaxID=59895 RepID=A0A103XY75_CYNCS|nr:Armadillo-like helical [Cynara cardunculus var. scolymus]